MSQKMKVNNLNLNDGFLKCYRDKNQKSDFNAPNNPKKYHDMEFIVELAFEEMSKRDKDLVKSAHPSCQIISFLVERSFLFQDY